MHIGQVEQENAMRTAQQTVESAFKVVSDFRQRPGFVGSERLRVHLTRAGMHMYLVYVSRRSKVGCIVLNTGHRIDRSEAKYLMIQRK